ncbi:MAG: aldehyde dehydrogenase (NADP(+)), partial [Candidatus Eisenbacteria bacterium]|nr:aldehyde dehydrogenase (NADP(+)) [Candidatus Eisenbacteria bacterium]
LAAFRILAESSGKERAALLEAMASRIEGRANSLVSRVGIETALPEARVRAELGRTAGQLRMFAALVRDGSWVDARIDHADPSRQPLPKPDVRSMLRPLGPVAVFCAGNFPLAFSVAGGDTAAALAAGNPVVAIAHPGHPGTAELVARSIAEAVAATGSPEGTFSLLQGPGEVVGIELVRDPRLAAVGFTGSRTAGMAIAREAAARPVPIPVFAEMSSVNPVVILPDALRERGAEIADALVGSVLLGVGQFCTNPGLILVPGDADAFVDRLTQLFASSPIGTMLRDDTCRRYREALSMRAAAAGVRTLARTDPPEGTAQAGAALFEVEAANLLARPALASEIFGPAATVVRWRSLDELHRVLGSLEGQLTATIHGNPEEIRDSDLIWRLQRLAGRVLIGGVPTGVEVGPAMVHGGPYPATSDGRSSSVGTRAITRFTRPVCFQNVPDALLPPELKEANPLSLWRLVDGSWGRA